jgi:hypothetical protein
LIDIDLYWGLSGYITESLTMSHSGKRFGECHDSCTLTTCFVDIIGAVLVLNIAEILLAGG